MEPLAVGPLHGPGVPVVEVKQEPNSTARAQRWKDNEITERAEDYLTEKNLARM